MALGLVTSVDGSPLKVDMAGDCDPYPETVYGADVNDIDGDGDNKSFENMRLLCPNCYYSNNGKFLNSSLFCKM